MNGWGWIGKLKRVGEMEFVVICMCCPRGASATPVQYVCDGSRSMTPSNKSPCDSEGRGARTAPTLGFCTWKDDTSCAVSPSSCLRSVGPCTRPRARHFDACTTKRFDGHVRTPRHLASLQKHACTATVELYGSSVVALRCFMLLVVHNVKDYVPQLLLLLLPLLR